MIIKNMTLADDKRSVSIVVKTLEERKRIEEKFKSKPFSYFSRSKWGVVLHHIIELITDIFLILMMYSI
jgi:hypothetical protein